MKEKYEIIESEIVTEKIESINTSDNQLIAESLSSDLILNGEVRKFTQSYVFKFELYSLEKNEIIANFDYTYNLREESSVPQKDDEDNKDDDNNKKSESIFDAIDIVCDSILKSYERKLFKSTQRRGGSSIELSYGLVNIGLVDEYEGWDYHEFFHAAKVGYSYQFSDMFTLGGDIGLLIVPSNSDILTGTINPMFGIQAIFGNKVDGFAGSIGLDIAPKVKSDLLESGSMTVPIYSLGLFYKNCFLKASYIKVKMAKILYFEAGYSIYLGK